MEEAIVTPQEQPVEPGNTPPVEVPEELVVKYKGEEHKVSLKSAEDITKLKQWAEKGYAYDQLTPKLKQAEAKAQQADAWNQLIADAKGNDESFNKLVSFIQETTGRKLTSAQKEELLDDIDPAMKEINALKSELAAIKNQSKEEKMREETQRIVARMQQMAEQPDKYPGFDLNEVYEAMVEKGISDPEIVYNHLKKDVILKTNLERELAKKQKEYEELLNKRRQAFTESNDSPAGMTPKTAIREKSYDRLAEKLVEKYGQAGKSFTS